MGVQDGSSIPAPGITDMKTMIGRPYLLQCDGEQSVLSSGSGLRRAYVCFGWSPFGAALQLGFNGVLQESAGGYLLGNGYRFYSPVLARFVGPDSLSPFGDGGINSYMYCGADPINKQDKSGHFPVPAGRMWRSKSLPSLFARALPDPKVVKATKTSLASSSRKASSAMAHLNDVERWSVLRDSFRKFENVPEKTLQGPYVIRELVDERAGIQSAFGDMFPNYNIRTGLHKSATSQIGFVDNDTFALHVLLQEMNKAKPLKRNMNSIRRSSF